MNTKLLINSMLLVFGKDIFSIVLHMTRLNSMITTDKQLLKFYDQQGGKAFVIIVHKTKEGYVILSTKPGCRAIPISTSLIHTLINQGIANMPTTVYIDFTKLKEKEAIQGK
jgi:hypothetical protein